MVAGQGAELEELNLIGCTELTAATLLEIATHCSGRLNCLKFTHAPPSRAAAPTPDPNQEQQAISMLHDSVASLVCASTWFARDWHLELINTIIWFVCR